MKTAEQSKDSPAVVQDAGVHAWDWRLSGDAGEFMVSICHKVPGYQHICSEAQMQSICMKTFLTKVCIHFFI